MKNNDEKIQNRTEVTEEMFMETYHVMLHKLFNLYKVLLYLGLFVAAAGLVWLVSAIICNAGVGNPIATLCCGLGLAFCGIMGFATRKRAAQLRYRSRLNKESTLNLYDFEDTFVRVRGGNGKHEYYYDTIHGMIETNHLYLLSLGTAKVPVYLILDKEGFIQGKEKFKPLMESVLPEHSIRFLKIKTKRK